MIYTFEIGLVGKKKKNKKEECVLLFLLLQIIVMYTFHLSLSVGIAKLFIYESSFA